MKFDTDLNTAAFPILTFCSVFLALIVLTSPGYVFTMSLTRDEVLYLLLSVWEHYSQFRYNLASQNTIIILSQANGADFPSEANIQFIQLNTPGGSSTS